MLRLSVSVQAIGDKLSHACVACVTQACGFTCAFALVCIGSEQELMNQLDQVIKGVKTGVYASESVLQVRPLQSRPPSRDFIGFGSGLFAVIHLQAHVSHRQFCFPCSQHILSVYRARAQPCLNCGEFGTLSDDGQKCQCELGTFGPSCSKPTWTPWSTWSACLAPCGDGSIKRHRQCNAPDGVGCGEGLSVEERPCDAGPCATEWSDWSSCAASCYTAVSGKVLSGLQSRGRNCVDPTGESCLGLATKQSRTCSKTCPIACPTKNSFQDCSGHGTCVLTPLQGCTREAICRCNTCHCHVPETFVFDRD